jgi:hypothetical protein
MESLTLILFGLVAVKVAAISNATRWARTHGNSYEEAYETHPPQSDEARFKLLEAYNGRFFPFGAKDYILRRFYTISRQERTGQKLAKSMLRFLTYFLFNARRLTVIVDLHLLVTNVLLTTVQRWHAYTLYGLALSLVLMNIALIIEAVSWYVVVRGYARPYFMLGFGRTWKGQEIVALDEITVSDD